MRNLDLHLLIMSSRWSPRSLSEVASLAKPSSQPFHPTYPLGNFYRRCCLPPADPEREPKYGGTVL
jgi:hypothetical protein